MPRKKQGLRSYHHKSRNGCDTCKRRKVKCDAQAPVCSNCHRRNEPCTNQNGYLNSIQPNTPRCTSEPMIIGSSTTKSITSVSTPCSSLSASVTGQSYDAFHLVYTRPHATPTSGTLEVLCPTSISMTSCLSLLLCNSWFSTYEASLWIPVLADQANRYRYVQHCLFSLSHLCRDRISSTSNPPFTSVTAYEHQVAAMTMFQVARPKIDETNWIAVMTFAVCMIVFQFSVQESCPERDFDYVETLRVLRSSIAINQESLPYLKKSKHWPLIAHRNSIPNKPLSPRMKASFYRLDSLISESLDSDIMNYDEEERAEINRQAFEELQKWTVECQGVPRTWKNYCEWPAAVNAEYLDLLAEGDDIALLILIHWCAVMYMSPKRWFVTAWSKKAATVAAVKLKKGWEGLLAWPWEIFTTRPEVSVRAILVEKYQKNARFRSASTRGFNERVLEGVQSHAQTVV